MINNNRDSSIYISTSFTEQAEKKLIHNLIEMDHFKTPYINRRLATYPVSHENERDIIILELMETLWNRPECTRTFSIFRDFESIFEILEKRGHFIHQFEVFLLGCLLMNQLAKKDINKIFESSIGDQTKCFYSWLYTSTVHDFGYPLQEANQIAKKVSELYNKLNMKKLADQYASIFSDNWVKDESELISIKIYNVIEKKYETIDINKYILNGILNSINGDIKDAEIILKILIDRNNHGYISSIIFCRQYIEYLSTAKLWNDDEKNSLEKIVAAIALHALPKENIAEFKKISFKFNPLSYLLILIDNLQDWNRTLRPSSQWPSYSLYEFEIYSDSINLKYLLEHENWTEEMKERVQDALIEKKELLNILEKPLPAFEFSIIIDYQTSDGYAFERIEVEL